MESAENNVMIFPRLSREFRDHDRDLIGFPNGYPARHQNEFFVG